MYSRIFTKYVKEKWGRIINISSIGGQWGGINQLHYAASKAALINLTRSISKLYSSKGVICNAISIGLVETDMTKNEIKTNLGLEKIKSIPCGRIGTKRMCQMLLIFYHLIIRTIFLVRLLT